jgi:hypothetical protein
MTRESEDSSITESQLRELINGLSANHILKQCPEVYLNGFVEAALGVYEPENLTKVLQQKFFILAESGYSDEGYYQAASELTVAWDIKKKERQSLVTNFTLEKPVNQGSLKDVDVYFEVWSTKVSLEVKCPLEEKRGAPPGNLTLFTAGRLPDHQRKLEELRATLSSGRSAPNVIIGKNRDLRMKDCLVSAHNKLSSNSGFDDLNILFFSMGHWYRISEWHMCLFGGNGLFGANSFHPTDSFSLVDVRELRVAVGSPEATMLIAIDQAEELLAPNVEESANQLLYLLSDAFSEADHELMAIATIRSDALGLLQQHPAVRGIEGRPELTFETLPLGPMPFDRVSEIIRGPARYIRLQIDDELVDAVRADVKTPDALPLLAYALQQLHARSGNNGRLTLPAYNQLGRLEGSIRKIADERIDFEKLATEDRDALRTTFVPTLIRATETGGFARDRALRERLPHRADPLVQKLVDAHLLVTDRDDKGRETVEIAHEALLRTWPTLISWLVEDRDKLRQHNAIARAAKDWMRVAERLTFLFIETDD